MHKIRPWLFVGTYAESKNWEWLEKHRINALLQVHKPVTHSQISTWYVPAVDGQRISGATFDNAIRYVRRQHRQHHRVLIACGAGISRSVTFTVASLKAIEGLSLEDAYKSVYEVHREAMPDHVHWQALCEYFHEEVSFWDLWAAVMFGI